MFHPGRSGGGLTKWKTEADCAVEFEDWWNTLNDTEQATVDAYARMSEEFRFAPGFPYSFDYQRFETFANAGVESAAKGRPYSVLYAFDPHLMAILCW